MEAQTAPDLSECAAQAAEAARIEGLARQLDSSGKSAQAVEQYELANAHLLDSIAACPSWHKDRDTLATHAADVQQRIKYLSALGDAPPLVPCEKHLALKQLTISDHQGVQGTQTLGLAVVTGAFAGLLMSGPKGGLLLALGAAHVTSRDDSAGHLVRKAGRAGTTALAEAWRRASTKLRRLNCGSDLLFRIGEVTCAWRATLSLGVRSTQHERPDA